MSAYRQGELAQECGRALLHNPFNRMTTLWYEWRKGWLSAYDKTREA